MSDVSIFSVLKSRNWEQLRAFLYMIVPMVLMATVDAHADVWIGLALAVLSPALASWKSVTQFRTWFQGVLTAAQLLLTTIGVFTEQQVTTWAQIALAVVGGSVAAANVHAKETTIEQ